MIIDPGEIRNLLLAFFAAAMVLAAGALYAILLTLAHRLQRQSLAIGAMVAYVILSGFVAMLAWAANLHGTWLILVGLMLLGYLFMPRMILRLCEATHSLEHGGDEEGSRSNG